MAGTPALAAQGDGSTRKSAASVFRENPEQSDPELELQRLRNEGIAKYESGIALDDALQAFQRAFERSGNAADAFNVAVVYFKRNDIATTRTWLGRALEQDPGFANAHYLLGVLARSEGDFEAAKKHWERARELAPDDSYLHYQLALLARSERNEPAFLQSLVRALALEPESSAALYQMYRYYQTSGNRELAEETLAKFNELKKREKFSRREKQKDPSKLAQPVLATGGKALEVIAVAPSFTLSEGDPGCAAIAADRFASNGKTVEESVAIACADGRLVRADPGAGPSGAGSYAAMGEVPKGTRDIRLEWLDEAGPRVLALGDGGLFVGKGLAGESADYASVLPGAAGPLALADLDADGDMDVATGGGQVPLTNAGSLAWTQEDALYKTGPVPGAMAGAKAAAVADLQRDGLSDLLILRDDGLVVTLGTPSGFREAVRVPAAAGARDLVVGDFTNDGRLDVALLMPDSIRFLWNLDGSADPASVTFEDIAHPKAGGARALATDYNNDGLLDLLVVASDGTATLLRNGGGKAFLAHGIGEWPKPAQAARLVPGDFDRDGREDFAYPTAEGRVAVARNATAGAGKSIALFANGVRAAPSGLLTQIEVRRGGHYSYRQSPGGVARIGIGDSDYVEVLRLEWTNGFVENKLKIDATAAPYAFKESERISGSCPSLFVWNGERFEYLTDTFISGPMGVPLDRGIFFPVRDRELVLIPGDRVRLRDGRLDIRFTEELHESVYIDRARLLVVDHPLGTAVYPHSRLAPAPAPAVPFYTAGGLIAARRATGSDGSDLTAALAEVDRVHADFFARSRNPGFAEPHWIELELPENVDPARVDALLATGWFFYFESTAMIAEAQRSGPNLPWPWIEQWVDGSWQDVTPVGLPTGKGKTAVAPVTGQLKSRRLRVRSGISVYWDRIAFSLGGEPAPTTAEAELDEATLRFRGFSELIARDPERFDYHAVRYSALWSPMRGRFTDYGPVEPLIAVADGSYALFGSGDEVALSFRVDRPPAPSQGRSYLLELIGYVKDGDRYTAHAGSVEPLPYLGLDRYPPPRDARLEAAQGRSPYRNRAPLDYTLTTIGNPHTAGVAQ